MTGIFATGKNGEFANNGKLLETIKEDLQFFKEKTTDQITVMGRKTWDSLPKKLPNRENWVFSTNQTQMVKPNGLPDLIFDDFEKLLTQIKNTHKDVFVIGGKQLIEFLINEIDTLIITTFPKEYEADVILDLEKILSGFKKKKEIKKPIESDLGYITITTWTR